MFAYELQGLERLNIKAIKWGSSYRVKVRGRTGKMVYVSNISNPKNRKLLAKQYKASEDSLMKHLSPDFKTDPKYRFYPGRHMESHLYEHIPVGEFYDKLENVLSNQHNAFKINIALGYDLISKTDPNDKIYFYPNLANTNVFESPVAINSKADIRKKVISEIRSMELADKLKYPSSGYRLKAITGFRIFIFQREHVLGDSGAVIPKIIRDNKHIINFPKTNNKCVFHCIANHLQNGDKKDPRFIQSLVKDAFKRYCSFKDVNYSLSLFRSFKPIDILQFDELEHCFQLAINVHTMDVETGKVERIRESDKNFDVINILSHENHALYTNDINMVQAKYQCPKCEMIFVSSGKLNNHKKNMCELVNIESFPAEPTIYRPAANNIQSLLRKYSIKNIDQYIDHFIVYDFEAILKSTGVQHGDSTIFENEHVRVSVSVCDSLTREVKCFVNDDPKTLLTGMFRYINKTCVTIQKYNVKKYLTVLRKIIDTYGLTGADIPGAPLGKIYKLEDVDGWIKEGEYADFYEFQKIVGSSNGRYDYSKIKQQIDQVPVFGFNSGRYDINLIDKDLFAVIETENIKPVIKNPSYICIATGDMRMLDISNYVPAGTSYDKYLTTYLGGCKCEDKVRCVCGVGKGIFPYEYITSFDVLNETQLPPKSAFESRLCGTSISNEDYEHKRNTASIS